MTTALALSMWIRTHGFEMSAATISGTSLASDHTLNSTGMSSCKRSLNVHLRRELACGEARRNPSILPRTALLSAINQNRLISDSKDANVACFDVKQCQFLKRFKRKSYRVSITVTVKNFLGWRWLNRLCGAFSESLHLFMFTECIWFDLRYLFQSSCW